MYGRVSPEARRVAEAHGLPLFSLPATTPLDQVEQSVLRYIVDRRAELHERAQDLHRQLSELALPTTPATKSTRSCSTC